MKHTRKINSTKWKLYLFVVFLGLNYSTLLAQDDFDYYSFGEKIVNILESGTPEKIVELTNQDDIDSQAKVLQSFLSVKDGLSRITDIKNFNYLNVVNSEKSSLLLLKKDKEYIIIKFHVTPENLLTDEFKIIQGKLNRKLALGEKIYKAKCFACHGNYAKGGVAPNLIDNYWKYINDGDSLLTLIAKGKKGTMMMAFESYLKPDEIKAVTLYIKALQNKKVLRAKKPEGEKKKIIFNLF